jgi:hypothetical protein
VARVTIKPAGNFMGISECLSTGAVRHDRPD